MKLSNKTALITGASKGIGRSIALGFAGHGADLFLTAREDQDGLNRTLEEARALGVKAEGGLYDAASLEDVQRLMDAIQSALGRLDILVNNAGIIRPTPFMEISPEQFERTVRTHLFGSFYHTQEALRRFMLPAQAGKIINLAAPAALRGSVGVADYAAAKGGIVALTRNVAKEFASKNIQVNAVVPIAKTRGGTARHRPAGRSVRVFCLCRFGLRDRPGGRRRRWHALLKRESPVAVRITA